MESEPDWQQKARALATAGLNLLEAYMAWRDAIPETPLKRKARQKFDELQTPYAKMCREILAVPIVTAVPLLPPLQVTNSFEDWQTEARRLLDEVRITEIGGTSVTFQYEKWEDGMPPTVFAAFVMETVLRRMKTAAVLNSMKAQTPAESLADSLFETEELCTPDTPSVSVAAIQG